MCGLALADFGPGPRSSDTLRGIVFPKNAKIAYIISSSCDFRPSLLRNDYKCQKRTVKWSPMGCLVTIFIVRVISKSFHCAQERDLPEFSVTSVVLYCPIVHCSAGAAQSHRYGSGAAC